MKKKKMAAIGVVISATLFLIVGWLLFWPTSKDEVIIGAVLPMTGDAAKYGKWSSQGAQLAVDEINGQGGINGEHIALGIQDSQTNPTAGTAAFNHLLATKRPAVVLTTLTGVSRALIPMAESNKVVLFANATLPGLTDGHDFVFRNVTNLASDVPAMVAYARDGLSKPPVALLWRNDEFGVWGSNEFSRLYAEAGGNVVATVSYQPTTEDFRSHLGRVSQGSPRAVYLLGYSEVGKIARQAQELGFTWQFLGITTMGDPEAIRLAAGALEGAVFTEPEFSLSSSDSRVVEFKENYRRRFGEDPEVWAATFYDAVMLISEGWRGRPLTSEELRLGLLTIRDFPGVSGSTTFLPNGDVQKTVAMRQIREGQPVPLSR